MGLKLLMVRAQTNIRLRMVLMVKMDQVFRGDSKTKVKNMIRLDLVTISMELQWKPLQSDLVNLKK